MSSTLQFPFVVILIRRLKIESIYIGLMSLHTANILNVAFVFAIFFLTKVHAFWCAHWYWCSRSVTNFIHLWLVQFEKFTHQMQDGWGLATDGEVLFGSDGTSTLYLIDPQTFKGFSSIHHLMSVPPPPPPLSFKKRRKWVSLFMTSLQFFTPFHELFISPKCGGRFLFNCSFLFSFLSKTFCLILLDLIWFL